MKIKYKKMKFKSTLFLLFFTLGIFFTSCDIINPEEEIPAYLYIESIDLETLPEEGSDSHNVPDVWLTVDGDFLGVYTLPALIPLLEKGERTIFLQAGIKDNGIKGTPEIYPFYKPIEFALNLKANVIDTLRPVWTYREETIFSFIEGFENQEHIFKELRIGEEAGSISLSSSAEEIFEGNHSALITLDTSNAVVEIGTLTRYFDLNDNGPVAYLEVNYKSDVPVFFGLVGYENLGSVGGVGLFDAGFVESTVWKKIYFNLEQAVFLDQYGSFQVAFQAFIPQEDGKYTLNSAKVLLDNIKLVHF